MDYLIVFFQMVLGHLLDGIFQGGSSFIESAENFSAWLFFGFFDALVEFVAIIFALA